MKRLPLCPLPIKQAKKASRIFSGPADFLSKISNLKVILKQANIPLTPVEYISIALYTAVFMFSISTLVVLLATINKLVVTQSLGISLGLGLVVFMFSFLYLKTYPKFLIGKRAKDIERNLLHALKHLLVQIKSGVSIYDAIVSIANGNYGAVSSEFKELVKEVDTGASLESALEEISIKNPSLDFRRSIWQISNGMKAGSDIGDVLEETLKTLSQQQIVTIRKYGSQLNPLTLVYMMIAVIIPALGVTFLFIFSAFSPISVTETTFYMILIGLVVLQFMYLSIIKSKRPNI